MHRRSWLRVAKKLPPTWRPIPPGLPHLPHPLPLQLAHAAQWFHCLAECTRLYILEFLSQQDRSVTELEKLTGAPLSTVSFHLKVLRESGLIREYRDGRRRYYSLRADTMEHMMALIPLIGPGRHVGTCPLSCCI
jgi:ArsR family transcriptional regulator